MDHYLLEVPMHSATRRRFLEILPLTGVTLMAACSKTPEPAPLASPPPPPMPAPPPEAPPASAPAATKAPEAAAPATSTANVPMVDPKEPQALALGYVDDATHADKVKYPKYASGNQCSNCALYQGKAGDASGGCPLFPGKQVASKGWCSAWVKKA
jgi:hypothetical protein